MNLSGRTMLTLDSAPISILPSRTYRSELDLRASDLHPVLHNCEPPLVSDLTRQTSSMAIVFLAAPDASARRSVP
jgi:hypothetical protein